MPAFRAVHRRELIRVLRRLGFDGPHAGGKHEYMTRSDVVLTILRQAGVSRAEWERA